MIICLVTDRRRLGAALGIGPREWLDALRAHAAVAASAGVDLIQIREPDVDAAELVPLVRAIAADIRGTAARVLVNDRVDVAIASGAAGVHLRERSFGVAAARSLGPTGFIVGRSIHHPPAEAFDGSADYFIAGTVQPTPSKPGAACMGWQGLADVVRATVRPVLAIGGIDVPSIPLVAASGAAGIAAIGAFIPEAGQGLAEFVQKRVIDLRLGFDSAHPVS